MKTLYSIGRDSECDIIIYDDENIVSRRHATLRVTKGGKYYLSDQSMNGTYVNGIRMRSGVEIPVRREDTISFAHVADLDWRLIPNRKRAIVFSVIGIILSLVVVVLMSVLIARSLRQHHSEPVQGTIGTSPRPQPSAPAGTDTLKVPDVELPSVKKPESKGKVKEPSSPEKIKQSQKDDSDEIVINPII